MNYVENLVARYPALASSADAVSQAIDEIIKAHREGGKILLCGNGGSAADCEHISGELLKDFMTKREPHGEELARLSEELGEDAQKLRGGIAAIPLTSLSASLSAFANDVDARLVYAQLVYALGRAGDVLIAISTSGNSENVALAVKCARALGIKTVALTGRGGGALSELADVIITAPESETYKVQEYHLPIYHAICAEVERIIFKKPQ